jgi:ribosomal protein L5
MEELEAVLDYDKSRKLSGMYVVITTTQKTTTHRDILRHPLFVKVRGENQCWNHRHGNTI